MPTARSNSQCPYCDHQSPAGSKFCNDCGAALHLRPCPHCGSVNDISLSTLCSRCNGELGEAADAPTEVTASVMQATAPPMEIAPAAPAELAKVSRAPWIAGALLAAAVGAYFGLRPAPEAPSIWVDATPLPAAASTVAVVTTAPAAPAPAPISAPAPTPDEPSKAAAPAVAASLARLAPPGAGRVSVRREAALPVATTAPAPAAPPDRRSGAGLDLKQPQIGTCTDAVAALGLCTPDSTPRRP